MGWRIPSGSNTLPDGHQAENAEKAAKADYYFVPGHDLAEIHVRPFSSDWVVKSGRVRLLNRQLCSNIRTII